MKILLTQRQPFSAYPMWKHALWLLSTLLWWSCDLTVHWLNGPCCWWQNKIRESKMCSIQMQNEKLPICEIVLCTCMQSIHMWMQRDPEVCCEGSAWSLSAAGRSTGLVEAHGFAQPPGKVHYLHFCSFDERVTLKLKANFCF